jgi:serine/threonine protein kinase/Tol biopolymer transport system component
MNCPHCAQVLREGALSCDDCGSSITGPDASEAAAALEASTASLDKAINKINALIGKIIGGKYRLISLLGEGGMGSVYRALRLHIGDEVAVKVLHPEYVNEATTIERFRREAQAAAMIRHPTVVTIHDFSEARDGEPAYIVMELVEGKTLRKILESEGSLDPQRAVAIMRQVCKGVGAAHRLQVVHRDIKPDNIMILPPDSDDNQERVKVLDFGIAKLRDMAASKTLTQTGKVIGTVYYMSPEQCCAEHLDARSDVYSLGAMLYEMLAGTPPFTAETATAIVAKHLSQPPPPLPEEVRVSPRLEAVLMRALGKEPGSRQSDASALGRELGDAIGAPQPRTTSERSSADTQRTTKDQTDKALSTARAESKVDESAKGESEAERTLTGRTLNSAGAEKGRLLNLPRWLGVGAIVAAILIGAIAFTLARRASIENHGGAQKPAEPVVENHDSWQAQMTLKTDSKVYAVAFSPDDKLLVTASSEGLREDREFISQIRLWDAVTGELKKTLTEHSEGILSVSFAPDGQALAGATGSGNAASKFGKVKLWDARTGELKWAVSGHTDFATSVAFSPDGRLIASGSLDHTVKLWDAQTGEMHQSLPLSDKVYAVAFSPDGKLLAIASQKAVELWDIESGKVQQSFSGNEYAVHAIAFSPDASLIAGGDISGSVELWDARSGTLRQTFKEHGDVVDAVAFAPDGKTLASGSYDSTVIIWNLQTMTRLVTLQETDKVTSVSFSHDGRTFASGNRDKTVHLWK